ncbi:MAG: FAD-dependent oxidoreductase [Oscillospiraceae bacterium]|nr:FAD-dependent oxidoreductase [Oscillospiraceae bacterium]
MEKTYDAVIVGAGTAGLTAAIYGARAGLDLLVLEKSYPGGQIIYAPHIENIPGFRSVSGVDFIEGLADQVKRLGVKIMTEQVTETCFVLEPKRIITKKNEYRAKSVIIAAGAEKRKIGCPGEEKFTGRGVSYCASCDGAFYSGKDVCVVGGGNTAFDDAVYLAKTASAVHIIHRSDNFRGNTKTYEFLKGQPNVNFITHTTVTKINGGSSVESVETDTKGKTDTLPVSAVFVAVGTAPASEIFSGVSTDNGGYIIAGEDCRTNIPGVYAAGDIRTKSLRQVVTAANDGAVAISSLLSDIAATH